ncbi:MAG: hypothetical protein WCC21_11545 [Candidatus Acidiferrales bacterium]
MLNLLSTRSYKLVVVFVVALAVAGTAAAQNVAGTGTNDNALDATALPAQPEASGVSDATAALPTAANASRPAPAPDTGSWSDNADEITLVQRLRWITVSTLGWQSLAWGVVSAGVGTAENHPQEYGTHWNGFADRYGIRLSGVVTSNVTEAGLGEIWGENPRYKPEPEKSFGGRIESVIYQTFFTRRADGNFEPAYARFIAIPGSNFMSNTWRVKDEADTPHALERTGYGFAGAMGSNAFHEFWPSVKSHLHF